MPTPKFTTTDKVIIIAILALYMLGYHFLMSSGSGESGHRGESEAVTATGVVRRQVVSKPAVRKRAVRSLNDWPLDLGKYFYTIDIDPGYEMEDEEWVEVEKVGDRYFAKRGNDWPVISGHFEWYCNEKLTTTQQMFDYVMAHHKAIVRQMQEVKRRHSLTADEIFDESSYYQDLYDEYQDDPEDEIRFPPEIFDANDE